MIGHIPPVRPLENIARSQELRAPEFAGLSSLGIEDRRAMNALPWRHQATRHLRPITAMSDTGHDCLVVESGFVLACRTLPGGFRFISDFFLPGDICNWDSLPCGGTRTQYFFSRGPAKIARVNSAAFEAMLARSGDASLAFRTYASARALALADRMTHLARGETTARLGLLLLQFMARLHPGKAGRYRLFDLPVTQSELADMLGLTSVHVNRTFKALEASGLITRKSAKTILLDHDGLVAACDFVDRFASFRPQIDKIAV